MKQRIITGLTMAGGATLLILYLPTIYFLILSTLIALWLAAEWSGLLGLKSVGFKLAYVLLIALCLFFAAKLPILPILIASFIFWLWAIFTVVTYPKYTSYCLGHWLNRGVVGIFSLVPCWLSINVIHSAQDGPAAALLLLYLVGFADTGAYFVGKFWGRHKLMPKVSPKKTWEGALGGLMGSCLVVIVVSVAKQLDFHQWLLMLALAVVVTFFSIIGDLLESVLKRQAGVKDSGKLLPGHGGMLDRIDSLLSAAPMFLIACLLAQHLGL